jgi:hypothetical protein
MNSILENLKNISFNGGGGKAHERLAEDAIKNAGYHSANFASLANTYNVNKTDLLILLEDDELSIEDGVYYYQPVGSQRSPDFIFKVDERVVFLECKSSTTKKPMWNSHIIKDNYHYLMSTKEGTLLLEGRDMMSKEVRKALMDYAQEQKELTKIFNENLLASPDNTMGWRYYPRVAIDQGISFWD